MVKLFHMKNTRKIFSVPVISNKKKNIHRSTFAHHTSTPLAFLYKKKNLVAKFSVPKPSVYRRKEHFPNRISKGYE